MADIHRMVFHDLRVLLQKLYGMPAHVFHIAVFCPQDGFDLRDLFFDFLIVMHYDALRSLFIMMDHCVHQDIQSGTFSCRNRDNRDSAQHLRKTVQVDLHAALFHDIHHVQRQNNRLFQFQKL